MAHITIEYSSNVADHHDIDALVDVVHRAALDNGLLALDALRTRATPRHHYRIANSDPRFAFVAINARLGPGREVKAKRAFLYHLIDAAESHIKLQNSPLLIAWSIEITELDPNLRINRNRVGEAMATEGS